MTKAGITTTRMRRSIRHALIKFHSKYSRRRIKRIVEGWVMSCNTGGELRSIKGFVERDTRLTEGDKVELLAIRIMRAVALDRKRRIQRTVDAWKGAEANIDLRGDKSANV